VRDARENSKVLHLCQHRSLVPSGAHSKAVPHKNRPTVYLSCLRQTGVKPSCKASLTEVVEGACRHGTISATGTSSTWIPGRLRLYNSFSIFLKNNYFFKSSTDAPRPPCCTVIALRWATMRSFSLTRTSRVVGVGSGPGGDSTWEATRRWNKTYQLPPKAQNIPIVHDEKVQAYPIVRFSGEWRTGRRATVAHPNTSAAMQNADSCFWECVRIFDVWINKGQAAQGIYTRLTTPLSLLWNS
jgi:hypothetical protein